MAKTRGPKVMESRYNGKCKKCGGFIPEHTMIFFEYGVGAWHRPACPAVPVEAPPFVEVPVAPKVEAIEAEASAAEVKLEAAREAHSAAVAAYHAAAALAGFCTVCEGKHEVSCPSCGGTGSIRVMSDVWECCRATVECPACKGESAKVATAEVEAARKAAVSAKYEVEGLERFIAAVPERIAAVLAPKKFARVRFVSGRPVLKERGTKKVIRKIPLGTEGVVVWIAPEGGRFGVKVGENEVVFTAERNLETVSVSERAPVAEPAKLAA